jgi:hypothetical protein
MDPAGHQPVMNSKPALRDFDPAGMPLYLLSRLMSRVPGDPELAQIRATPRLWSVKNGRLGAYMWLALGPYEEDEVRCRYEPGPRATHDLGLRHIPAARGAWRLAVGEALGRGVRAVACAGYRWTLSRMSSFNLASSVSQARMGADRIRRRVFVVLCGCQLRLDAEASPSRSDAATP